MKRPIHTFLILVSCAASSFAQPFQSIYYSDCNKAMEGDWGDNSSSTFSTLILQSTQPAKSPERDSAPRSEVFRSVEQMPEFPGNVQEYLKKNMRYPAGPAKEDVEGKTIVQFVVCDYGAVTDVRVIRSSGNAELDAEALRLIRGMPRWKPGRKAGRAVDVFFVIPVTFKLE